MNWLYSLIPFPTKRGKILMAITTGLLLAGVNTGNNLLYLIFSTVLALLTISYLAAGYLLRFIRLSLRLPNEINAGEEFACVLRVDNTRGRIPVMVESFKILSEKILLKHSTILNDKTSAKRDIYHAPAGKESRGNRYMIIHKRGRYSIKSLQVIVTCPLGLIGRRLRKKVHYEMIVYPELKESEILSTTGGGIPLIEGSSGREGNGDLFNIREYILGDDSRFIDWKSTAKVGNFMTKEMRGGESSRITIFFDRNPGPLFEERVRKAAWLCDFFLNNGYEVRFFSDNIELPPEKGSLQRKEILTYLSTVQPSRKEEMLKKAPFFLRDSKVFIVCEKGEKALTSNGQEIAVEQKQ